MPQEKKRKTKKKKGSLRSKRTVHRMDAKGPQPQRSNEHNLTH